MRNDNTSLFWNATRIDAAYRNILRKSKFYDRVQILFLMAAAMMALAAVVFVFLHVRFAALCAVTLAIGLLWFRPLLGFFHRVSSDAEIRTTFLEREFVQTVNGEERRYFYSALKRVTYLGDWILLEGSKCRVLLDGNGFEGMTLDEFFWFMRNNFPNVPVKKKSVASPVRRFLPLVLATALFVLVTDGSVFLDRYMQRNKEFSSSKADGENTLKPSVSTPVNDSRVIADPLKTYDCDLFSIDLPDSFLVAQGNYLELRFYSNLDNTSVWVKFDQKNAAEISDLSLAEFVETRFVKEHGIGDVFTSDSGNLCFESNESVVRAYFTFMDSQYFFITVAFMTLEGSYETYRPHFEVWEASITWNEIPTGSILYEPKTWETDDIKFTVPAWLWRAKLSGSDMCLLTPENVYVVIASYEKTAMPQVSNCTDAILEFAREEGYVVSEKDIELSASGNPYYVVNYEDSDSCAYYFYVESKTEYILIRFEAPADIFNEYMPTFEKWESTIVVKEPPSRGA